MDNKDFIVVASNKLIEEINSETKIYITSSNNKTEDIKDENEEIKEEKNIDAGYEKISILDLLDEDF